MQTLFWITLSLLFYTYLGYGLLLFAYNAMFSQKKAFDETLLPELTFIVPAYNEEGVIQKKIDNCLTLDYPAEKIFFVFVTDGSTDATAEIIRRFPQIGLLHQPKREGKSAAINRAMQGVQTPVVVFSDANAMVHPQSLRKMVRCYADENVGGVSGEKRIVASEGSSVSFGEMLYWQYESLLKKANGDFYTIVGAAGELFSIRTTLFKPLQPNFILDDFALSANVCLQGFRFLYEVDAFAVETSSASYSEERKRKVRISAGCYQALAQLPQLLNPFKNFRLAFQYVSHRVLRWVACPLALPVLFFCSLFLKGDGGFYAFLFWTQCSFYFTAILGRLASAREALPKLLLVPYYFVFMVAAQYTGFYRFITQSQPPYWEKSQRKDLP